MNTTQETLWSDSMILESIRDGHGMTKQATARAFELARAGMIDMTGTWKLTALGEARISQAGRMTGEVLERVEGGRQRCVFCKETIGDGERPHTCDMGGGAVGNLNRLAGRNSS